jgi:hypothetical protein
LQVKNKPSDGKTDMHLFLAQLTVPLQTNFIPSDIIFHPHAPILAVLTAFRELSEF